MNTTTSRDLIKSLDNPATSFWLGQAIKNCLQRDPYDALLDVSILKEILEKRLDEYLLDTGRK